jgi:ATP-binding protein involved in chromosome partitioning
VKNTIAVASGKGGVGKSTVAVNLAVALALEGAHVGLVDADIYGPSIPLMMGITGRPRVRGTRLQPMENHGVKVMSIGFLVDPMQAVIWRGPMASGAVKQFMSDVDWGELDYLIFDLPPGTGDIQLTLVQTIPLTGAVVVTTPQDISLADARKGFAMFGKVDVPVLGIIENMSYHICSACGHRDNIFDSGGGRRAAEELGVPFLGAIPLYTQIRVSGDTGRPVVLDQGEHGSIIRSIARNLASQVSIRNAQIESTSVDIQI